MKIKNDNRGITGIMNNTQEHETFSMSKKDCWYRLPYVHFKTIKQKFLEFRKGKGSFAESPRRWNEC